MARALRSCLALVACLIALAAAPVAGAADSPYEPPVVAPIVDHFRPPTCTWCPGNRGIDYATSPGQAVTAANDGRVDFAGLVAGTAYVVVSHADGLRTTYGDLASIAVAVGQSVTRGQVVGVAGSHLHFGVRRGDRYLDPEALFAGRLHRARLVPVDRASPGRTR